MIQNILVVVLMILPQVVYGQSKGWEKEWNDTLEGAKKEGKLVVATSPDPVMREIAAKFKARYGITLEHLAGSSSQLAARLGTGRRAGIYAVDVFLGGVQTVANVLYPEKMLDPLKPALLLPEVVDPKKWKPGKPWFIDPEERYVMRVYGRGGNMSFIWTADAPDDRSGGVADRENPSTTDSSTARSDRISNPGGHDDRRGPEDARHHGSMPDGVVR
jgi:hypothetical protein